MSFDSKQYSWANVEVVMLGRPLIGIRGVKYKISQEKEPVYGRGNKPLAIQSGNKKYEGSIDLLQSEAEALEKAAIAAGGDDIFDLAGFDITVAYVPKDSATVSVDIIKGVSFSESEKGMKQGDKNMEVSLSFIALDIQKQA